MSRPRKYKLNEHYFDLIDTPEKAYWLGFIYADGYIDSERSCVKLETSANDIIVVKRLRRAVGSDAKIEFRTDKRGIESCCLRLYSSHMIKSLESLGCIQNKSAVIRFPTDDIVPANLKWHFIRGYLDGDGSIWSYQDRVYHVTICGNEHFCNELMQFCNEHGIGGYVRRAHKNDVWYRQYEIGGNLQVQRFLDMVYADSGKYLERKHARYIKLKQINLHNYGRKLPVIRNKSEKTQITKVREDSNHTISTETVASEMTYKAQGD